MTDTTVINTLPTERRFRLGFIPRWMLIASLMALGRGCFPGDRRLGRRRRRLVGGGFGARCQREAGQRAEGPA